VLHRTCEDSTVKSTKHWKSGEEGAAEWKYNGGVNLFKVHYTCMELSQWNPHILLMYANSKL
jgi:hypothetical protein